MSKTIVIRARVEPEIAHRLNTLAESSRLSRARVLRELIKSAEIIAAPELSASVQAKENSDSVPAFHGRDTVAAQ